MIYKFSEGSVVNLSKVVGMELYNTQACWTITLYFKNNQIQIHLRIDPNWTAEKAKLFDVKVKKEYDKVCDAYKKEKTRQRDKRRRYGGL